MKEEKQKIPPWLMWCYKRKRELTLFIFVFVLATMVYYRFLTPRDEFQKFSKQETLFQNWQKEPRKTELRQEMIAALKKNSYMKAKYLNRVAQEYLIDKDSVCLADLALKNIERWKSACKPFASFSHSTFLISSGNFEEALLQAKQLQKELLEDCRISQDKKCRSMLYLWNLFRIVLLENILGRKEQELLTWKEYEELLADSGDITIEPKIKDRFLKKFHKANEVEFIDFISHRKSKIFSKN